METAKFEHGHLKSEYEYPDGLLICHLDMIEFNDGQIGFVYYDDRVKLWSVKWYNHEEQKAYVMSLKNTVEFIKRFIV